MAEYPPERHLFRDLRLRLTSGPGDLHRVDIPLPGVIRAHSGAVQLGALAVLVDVAAAGLALRTIAPDWLATSELVIHARSEGLETIWARARPSLLRSGRTTAVFDVDVTGHDREDPEEEDAGLPLAHSTMTFVRIKRPDATTALEHPAEQTEETKVDFGLPASGLQHGFAADLGIEVADANRGQVRLGAGEFCANSFGSLQGGIVAALAEASATTARQQRVGRSATARDLSVHFLAQGRGPYRTEAEPLRTTTDHDLYRIRIIDEPHDTVMATASVIAAG